MNYKISHPTKIINCEINLPSSKSISNRLLIIRALCDDDFDIINLSESNDTRFLKNALKSNKNEIYVGDAGTSFRFLTSFFAIQNNKNIYLNGSQRMKERPIQILVDVLIKLGAKIKYTENKNFPPLKISGSKIKGGIIELDGSISSQFVSSILLIAPLLENGIELLLKGKIASKSYIEMTLKIMKIFGISYSWYNNVIRINKQQYIPTDYIIESDWSSASFWFEIAALSKSCRIKLNGLDKESLQGDQEIINIFSSFGVKSEFIDGSLFLTKSMNFNLPKNINLINTPDLYQPLKCTIFGLGKNTSLSGTKNLKYKETNRLSAVSKELKAINNDKIINTYNDHRMAMSFAPLCLRFGEIKINDIKVVNKSYPNFWNDLQIGGFKIIPSDC
jgi:3-phosphoshikimate 1-carboxyvinyltransferase